jgi:hypothetical protein
MRIVIRNSKPSDYAFMFATYLRNRYFDKNNKTTLKRSTWSDLHHKRLESILPKALVACLSEDEDTILGYSFIDGKEPWVYVKLAWRSQGLDLKTKLLKELII